jgi:threonine/homoserine/homoserine lactone efflux protein
VVRGAGSCAGRCGAAISWDEQETALAFDYQVLWAFTLLWLAILPTPGANSLLIVHLALTGSWRQVAIALIGNLIGIAGYALATLLGLALLLATAPSVRLIIYVLGGAYLVWVGAQLLRKGLKGSDAKAAAASADGVASATGTFAQGLLTALANVQALFFLASIFAGVGLLKANLATGLAAVGIILLGNGCYLMLLAWLMQKPAARSFYSRYQASMQVGFGVLFVVFGARLLARELAGWP